MEEVLDENQLQKTMNKKISQRHKFLRVHDGDVAGEVEVRHRGEGSRV